jgi:hypothetical protein
MVRRSRRRPLKAKGLHRDLLPNRSRALLALGNPRRVRSNTLAGAQVLSPRRCETTTARSGPVAAPLLHQGLKHSCAMPDLRTRLETPRTATRGNIRYTALAKKGTDI